MHESNELLIVSFGETNPDTYFSEDDPNDYILKLLLEFPFMPKNFQEKLKFSTEELCINNGQSKLYDLLETHNKLHNQKYE